MLADSFAKIKPASSKYDRYHASLLLYCGTFLTMGGTLWALVSSCRTKLQFLCKDCPLHQEGTDTSYTAG